MHEDRSNQYPSITRYLEGYKVSSNIHIGVLLHHSKLAKDVVYICSRWLEEHPAQPWFVSFLISLSSSSTTCTSVAQFQLPEVFIELSILESSEDIAATESYTHS
jgi:hypothetical protein